MSQTHQVAVTGDVVTKTYVDHARGEHHREWEALTALTETTPGLVPTPLRRTGDPSITMTRLPGSPLGGSLTEQQLDALERALHELWSARPAGLRPISLTGVIQRITSAVSSWTGGGVLGEANAVAGEWLPRAEVLVRPADPVVGHGDPNLANYLWDGQRIRIVDFEDAGLSDRAVELANLVEHLASRQTDWTKFADRFAVDRERYAIARVLWATFWLTLIRPGGPSADRNPPGTAEAQAERVLTLIRQEEGGG
ncbi:phosphotransferase family enzyme [Kribbella amoyensis]|uniref:Phosphotransferase family enzyme n=1 Tax=Kribbella amoyensis TaxID=996641 RepID=A0A561BPL5_9ACTN|nr:aminoglycoside phosphotransferase family protein [Kribbella amoyensis]TWD80818.1 phosphotransferase family enzyme [Kribbella amoyensis]